MGKDVLQYQELKPTHSLSCCGLRKTQVQLWRDNTVTPIGPIQLQDYDFVHHFGCNINFWDQVNLDEKKKVTDLAYCF